MWNRTPELAVDRAQEIAELKRKTKDLILEKLRACSMLFLQRHLTPHPPPEQAAKPYKIVQMSYTHFDTRITERCGVVCENWPLPRFCPPGDLSSKFALESLYQAWEANTAKFRKLSPQEHELWKQTRAQLLAQICPPPPAQEPIPISVSPEDTPLAPVPQAFPSGSIPFSNFVWPPPDQVVPEQPRTASPSNPTPPTQATPQSQEVTLATTNPLPLPPPRSPFRLPNIRQRPSYRVF